MQNDKGEPRRFRRYPYGPGYSRLIASGLCIVLGAVYALKNVGGLVNGAHNAVVPFIIGSALAVVGIIGLRVAFWIAKRNL